MFEKAIGCILTKRDLVCSMVTVSENATLMTILVMDPQCKCEKQEYNNFHSLKIVICDTSTISVNAGVLLKESFFKLILNILTHCLLINIHCSLFQYFLIHKILSKAQYTVNLHLIVNFIFQGKVNKMCSLRMKLVK